MGNEPLTKWKTVSAAVKFRPTEATMEMINTETSDSGLDQSVMYFSRLAKDTFP